MPEQRTPDPQRERYEVGSPKIGLVPFIRSFPTRECMRA